MKHFKLLLLFIITISCTLYGDIERRAAIDIGSGSTKVALAEVDTEQNIITEVLLDESYPIPFQAALDTSPDGTFDEKIQQIGIEKFKEIKQLLADHEVQKTVWVATSAFRKANNSKEYVTRIKNEIDVAVNVIPQREEGELAFFSAIATGENDPAKVVVWDIGTGSLQMTTKNDKDQLAVYMGEQMGSVAFKSYIIGVVQKRDVDRTKSPNPMTQPHVDDSDYYVRAFGRKAFSLLKEKIKEHQSIVGIGRLFYQSLRPIAANEEGYITRAGLRNYINNAIGKTDEELNNPFAHVDVPNCILALGMMKALHIQEIYPIDTTSTRGMRVYPNYWPTTHV